MGPALTPALAGAIGSLVAGAATGLGALPIIGMGAIAARRQNMMMGFAAGVMPSVIMSQILPSLGHEPAERPQVALLAHATTKGAIQNFTCGLAQLLGDRAIRVNCVAPGPVWTPLIPSTMPDEAVKDFGQETPLGRPAQPREPAPAYVMLATDEASYVSGATIAVTGGKPIL